MEGPGAQQNPGLLGLVLLLAIARGHLAVAAVAGA
jgi:hypothetical protein